MTNQPRNQAGHGALPGVHAFEAARVGPVTRTGDIVWAAAVAGMLGLVTLALLAAPERALHYWYLLAAPLLTSAFRFGFVGAAVSSGIAVVVLAIAFQSAGKTASEATRVAQRLIDAAGSPREVQELAFQVTNLRDVNPELDLFRAMTGVAVVVVGCILLGKSLDNRQRSAIFLQRAFDLLRRYFSPQIVAAILTKGTAAASGPASSRKEVTVLFADLRSFTPLAERLEPEETAALLNEFFSAMTDEIFREDGTLDKYLGDGLMAFFGDPIWYPDHPERACRTALAMQARMRDLQALWRSEGREVIEMGIGVSTGYVVAGNTGSAARMDYTVIGSTVNIASRLTDLAGPGEILATRKTYVRVGHVIDASPRDPVSVKGFANPVDIVEIRGARTQQDAAPGREAGKLTPLIARLVDDPSFRADVVSNPGEALAGQALRPDEQALVRQVALVSGSQGFRGLPADEMVLLLSAGKVEQHPEGEWIIRQGDTHETFYVILEGDVVVTMTDEGAQERHVASLGRGDCFGEIALLYDTLRTATVRTVSTATVLALEGDHFYDILAVAPTFRDQVERTARERLSEPLAERRARQGERAVGGPAGSASTAVG